MPVSLHIDYERRLTFTICEGVVTDEDLLRAREEVLADPTFDPSFDRIWDFHDVTETQVSEPVVARMVAESPHCEKPICRAVVVSERAGPMPAILNFIGLTRLANRRIAAFPDRKSAEEWVAVARVDLPPE